MKEQVAGMQVRQKEEEEEGLTRPRTSQVQVLCTVIIGFDPASFWSHDSTPSANPVEALTGLHHCIHARVHHVAADLARNYC